ncbi:MAG: ABC transporter permease [Chloroflexota bacterium]
MNYDSQQEGPPFVAEIRELGQSYQLLANLVWYNIAARYRRTWVGIFWVMLYPLLMTAVLAVVFSGQYNPQVEHYIVYLLAGLIVWTVFSEASASSLYALSANANILNSIHVPPSIFVLSTVLSSLIVHSFEILPLLLIAAMDGIPVQLGWLLLPVPLILTAIFSFGIGLMLASFVIYFTDIVNIYQVVLRIGFFATPIFYNVATNDGRLGFILRLNPVTYYLESFRYVVYHGQLRLLHDLLPAILFAVLSVALGWLIFTRVKRDFAYRI